MNVRGIVWMGIQTERYEEMATFLRALIGEASLHVRAPDDNIYEIVHDPDHGTRSTLG